MLLVSIQVGKPRALDSGVPERESAPHRPWRTGYAKAPVAGPVQLGLTNLEGDGQANKRYHGGPEMAVLAYSADHYPRWRDELEMPELPFGAFAENLTVSGADEETVCLGDVWEIGAARLQICQPRKPCANISRYWQRQDLLQRVIDTGRIGWYLRVLQTGPIEAGEEVRLLSRPRPEWSVARAMRVRLAKSRDPASAAALAALPELGEDWRGHLIGRT